MFDLGIQELIIIFVVAIIVVGPKKLPELGNTIGKGMRELKRAMFDMKSEFDKEVDETNKNLSLDTFSENAKKKGEEKDKKDTGNV